jgi:SAM-dependent methyltransferase
MIMSSQSSNFHASDGAAYEFWLGRWSRRLADLFLDFVEFPEAGELLDVGCGTGALTFTMADRWPARPVIGVDIAAPFISYAQSRRFGDRPTFEIGDACALKYADGRFAGAAAHLVFLFIPKPEVALREMRRVTRSGGTVAAVVWDSRGGLVFQRMLWDTAVAIDPNAHVARDSLFANPVAIPAGWRVFSMTLDSRMSRRNPSPFGWNTRISRITGSRSSAAKGRLAPISPILRQP